MCVVAYQLFMMSQEARGSYHWGSKIFYSQVWFDSCLNIKEEAGFGGLFEED